MSIGSFLFNTSVFLYATNRMNMSYGDIMDTTKAKGRKDCILLKYYGNDLLLGSNNNWKTGTIVRLEYTSGKGFIQINNSMH